MENYQFREDGEWLTRESDGAQVHISSGEIVEWMALGNTPLSAAPPTIEQLSAEIDFACDKHYDAIAADRGWGRVGITPSAACSARAGYPNQWQAEAIKFGQWVDSCVAYLIVEKAKVIAGTRTMPTPEEAIAELPLMLW